MGMTLFSGVTAMQGAWHGTSTLGAVILQQDVTGGGYTKWIMIFVIVAAISLFLQLVVIAMAAMGALKAQKNIEAHVVEMKSKLMPLMAKSHAFLENTHGLVTDLTPQIKEITGKVNAIAGKIHEITVHAEEIAGFAKDKVNEFAPTLTAAYATVDQANETVREANAKTRVQVERLNGMVSSALDATERMGKAIQHGITQPGRELAGIVSGAKAFTDHLMNQSGGAFTGLGSKLASMFAKKTGAVKPFGSMADTQIPTLHPYKPKPENTPRF